MREFMMFSLGVPLSKQSYPNYLSLEKNRMSTILQSLPEVKSLSQDMIGRLSDSNIPLAVALLATRLEISSGHQQVLWLL